MFYFKTVLVMLTFSMASNLLAQDALKSQLSDQKNLDIMLSQGLLSDEQHHALVLKLHLSATGSDEKEKAEFLKNVDRSISSIKEQEVQDK